MSRFLSLTFYVAVNVLLPSSEYTIHIAVFKLEHLPYVYFKFLTLKLLKYHVHMEHDGIM